MIGFMVRSRMPLKLIVGLELPVAAFATAWVVSSVVGHVSSAKAVSTERCSHELSYHTHAWRHSEA